MTRSNSTRKQVSWKLLLAVDDTTVLIVSVPFPDSLDLWSGSRVLTVSGSQRGLPELRPRLIGECVDYLYIVLIERRSADQRHFLTRSSLLQCRTKANISQEEGPVFISFDVAPPH